jgi:DNA-binding response OmpR family regulator
MAKLLLVEPDKQLADIYRLALEASGHNVNVSHNAASAINSLDDDCPEMLIIELELPAHNGVELLYELRSYVDWRHIPAIILTNQPFSDNARMQSVWQRLGVSGHYYKPTVTLNKLCQLVDKHMAIA